MAPGDRLTSTGEQFEPGAADGLEPADPAPAGAAPDLGTVVGQVEVGTSTGEVDIGTVVATNGIELAAAATELPGAGLADASPDGHGPAGPGGDAQGPGGEEPEGQGGQMTLMEHLAELRRRVTICAAAVVVTSVAGYFLYNPLLRFMTSPYRDFVAHHHGTITSRLIITSPVEGFATRVKIAMYVGLALAA
ncbi:MAG TPA: twin-arginine translocase subunit TatC, partial [Acidimicrobiales bacterium]|nr:twin-arginine translocase subunit TatC [Acidimicrobiales bacterium]